MAKLADGSSTPGSPTVSAAGGLGNAAVRMLVLLALIVAVGLVVGPMLLTTRAPQSAPSPSSPAGAIVSPSTSEGPTSPSATLASSAPSPCRNVVDHPMKATNTVPGLSAFSDVVIVGTVTQISEGRWTRPDGGSVGTTPSSSDVYRVVTIEITGVGKDTGPSAGKARAGQTIEVRTTGGSIGCSNYRIQGAAEPVVGQSQGFFLGHLTVLDPAPRADFDAIDIWPTVNGQLNGLSPEAFLAQSLGS
jgi:hypothetical protein